MGTDEIFVELSRRWFRSVGRVAALAVAGPVFAGMVALAGAGFAYAVAAGLGSESDGDGTGEELTLADVYHE